MKTKDSKVPKEIYKFHPLYFVCHIAKAISIDEANSYVWGTTQTNRKKYLSDSTLQIHSIDFQKLKADTDRCLHTLRHGANPWVGVDARILKSRFLNLKRAVQSTKETSSGHYQVESFCRFAPYILHHTNNKRGTLKLEAVLVLSIYHRLFANNIPSFRGEGCDKDDWEFMKRGKASTVYQDISQLSYDSLVHSTEYKNMSDFAKSLEDEARMEIASSLVQYLWKESGHFADAHKRTKQMINEKLKNIGKHENERFLREAYGAVRNFQFDISGHRALAQYCRGNGLPGIGYEVVLFLHSYGARHITGIMKKNGSGRKLYRKLSIRHILQSMKKVQETMKKIPKLKKGKEDTN